MELNGANCFVFNNFIRKTARIDLRGIQFNFNTNNYDNTKIEN